MRRRFARHPMSYGMAGGLLWGAVMRAWMRYISTDPEFSWGGTGFILGASAIVGAAMGAAWLRRERHGRGLWRLLGLTVLLVGTGAGTVMMPSVLLGAVAFGRTTWRRGVRATLLAAAACAQVIVFASDQLPPGRALLAYPWYAAMITIEAYALSIVFRPAREGAPTRPDVQRVAVVVALCLVAVPALTLVGIGPPLAVRCPKPGEATQPPTHGTNGPDTQQMSTPSAPPPTTEPHCADPRRGRTRPTADSVRKVPATGAAGGRTHG